MTSSLSGATGYGRPTSTGTMKRGGRQGEVIPKGYRAGQLANFTPEQMGLFEQMFSHVGPDSYLSKLAGGDQSTFGEIEAPALRQFNELQGGMASRFSQGGGGRGALGARKSSGFQNSSNAAASDFAQQLQSQRQGLQRQALQDLRGMSQELLNQRPYERFMQEKQQKQGFNWGGLGGGLLGAAGGFFAGGPMGAMSGAGMGYNMGSSLSGHGGTGGGGGGFQSTPGWQPSWNGRGGQPSLGAGYDQEFRMNPSAMGY